MKKLLVPVAIALSVATMPASAGYTLKDGTYTGRFAGNACGKMTIKNGRSITYKYHPKCGGPVQSTRFGSFDGSKIVIDAATYTLTGASASRLTGKWSLRGQTRSVTFSR